MKTPTWNDTINGRIQAIARINGLSSYQVAETIRKSQSYAMQRYDAKREWKPSDIENFAKAMGYSILELTGDDFSLKIPTTALDLLASPDTGENQSADTGRN